MIKLEMCSPNTCHNGGACQRINDTSFECLCPPGYKGKRCEIKGTKTLYKIITFHIDQIKLYDHSRSCKDIEYFILDPICGTLGDHCGLTPVDPSKYRACCDDFKCRRYNDSGLGTCVKMHPAGSINIQSIFFLI